MSRTRRRMALALLTALALVGPMVPSGAATTYRPPVDAPVVDGFRLPDGPYGAGNRGLEYATRPGQEVRAIGTGVVTFAGPVAGTRAVTVRHPDGLRSSLTHLSEVLVAPGQRVALGEVVGRAGERLHLGVRSGGTYLDPAALFTTPMVRLVPLGDGPAPPIPAGPPADGAGPLGPEPIGPATWTWLTGGGVGRLAGTLARRS